MLHLDSLSDNVRALIFDCDGTLVDTLPVYARAWATGFRLSGHEITSEWYFARAGMSEHVLMDQFEAEFGVRLQRGPVVSAMRAAFLEELHDLKEIEAISEIARKYRRRIPLAVASGGSRAIVNASLEATGLTELFDAVVTIEDVLKAKPDPDLFLEAARRLGVPTENCMVFEDSREGLEAAKRAEMRAIDVLEVIKTKLTASSSLC